MAALLDEIEINLKCRIGKASTVFQQMCKIWSSTSISLNIKLHLYASIILPKGTYAAGTWKADSHKVDVFHWCCLQRILHIRYYNHIINDEVLRRSNMPRLCPMITHHHLWLAGHIMQMESSRIPKKALQWFPPGGRRCTAQHSSMTSVPLTSHGKKPMIWPLIAFTGELFSPNMLLGAAGEEEEVQYLL